MGIEQSKFIFEDIKDENKVLSINKLKIHKRLDEYLNDPYYLTEDYYSKILLLEELNKDFIYICPIEIDNLNFRIIIKKNNVSLYENKIKKENFIESIKIIEEIFKFNRRELTLIDSKIRINETKIVRLLRRLESEDENENSKQIILEEIKKINIEVENLDKEKSTFKINQNNLSQQIKEKKKKNTLNEYEKVLINNFEGISSFELFIFFCSDELEIFDYSKFDIKTLNIESEFRFNNLSNDEILKKIDQMKIYNESFSYFVQNSLPEKKIYFIRNLEKNDKAIKFSIIKNNELKTYSGGKRYLKEFLDNNFKDETFYIIDSLESNEERSLNSSANLILSLITTFLYFKKR